MATRAHTDAGMTADERALLITTARMLDYLITERDLGGPEWMGREWRELAATFRAALATLGAAPERTESPQ